MIVLSFIRLVSMIILFEEIYGPGAKALHSDKENKNMMESKIDEFILKMKSSLIEEMISEMKPVVKQELRKQMVEEVKEELQKDVLNTLKDEMYSKIKANLITDIGRLIMDNVQTELQGSCTEELKNSIKEELESLKSTICKQCSKCGKATSKDENVSDAALETENIFKKTSQRNESGIVAFPRITNLNTRRLRPEHRVQRTIVNVAFTAYLDHNLHHLSDHSTVKFNQILLNDGNAYNKFTGVFSAPMDGTYLFAFEFLASSRMTQLRLVVDNINTVDGKVQYGNSGAFGLQGGNLAIIRLKLGQSVWVENYIVNDADIDSEGNFRFTTFSGVLLY